jgi:hypothetical protein
MSREQDEEDNSGVVTWGQGVTDIQIETIDWLYEEIDQLKQDRRRLLACLGVEAGELTERQGADLLHLDVLDFRRTLRMSLAAVAKLRAESVSRDDESEMSNETAITGETGVTARPPRAVL